MIHTSLRFLRAFAQHTRAAAIIEFALLLPLMIVFLYGVVELSRRTLIYQKVDKVDYVMGDFATQSEASCIGRDEMNAFAEAVNEIMNPFNIEGSIIFTSVSSWQTAPPPPSTCPATPSEEDPPQPCINWQYSPNGASGSRVGSTAGSRPNLPDDFEVKHNQNVIIVEVFFPYAPLLPTAPNWIPSLAPTTIYRIAFNKPRSGALSEMMATCPR